jgi:hypothetical protein
LRLRRQFGKQYGGMVEVIRAIAHRAEGKGRGDAFAVRTTGEEVYLEHSATTAFNAHIKPQEGGLSHKAIKFHPAMADVQPSGRRPLGVCAFGIKPPRAGGGM